MSPRLRDRIKTIRFTNAERLLIESAAEATGTTFADLTRTAAVWAAERILSAEAEKVRSQEREP